MFRGTFRRVSKELPEVPWGFLGDFRGVSLFFIIFQSSSEAYHAVSGGFRKVPEGLSGNSDGIKEVLRVFRDMFHGFLRSFSEVFQGLPKGVPEGFQGASDDSRGFREVSEVPMGFRGLPKGHQGISEGLQGVSWGNYNPCDC